MTAMCAPTTASRIEVPPPVYHSGRNSASSDGNDIELPPYPSSAPAFASYNPFIKSSRAGPAPIDNAAAEAQQHAPDAADIAREHRVRQGVAKAPRQRGGKCKECCSCIVGLLILAFIVLCVVSWIWAVVEPEPHSSHKGPDE